MVGALALYSKDLSMNLAANQFYNCKTIISVCAVENTEMDSSDSNSDQQSRR